MTRVSKILALCIHKTKIQNPPHLPQKSRSVFRHPISPSKDKSYDKCDMDLLSYIASESVSIDPINITSRINNFTIDILRKLQRQFRIQQLRQV